ncbi:MAG TPA: ABC transporter ATP-binding protein [Acidimicrobiales bacterium]|nr:ABC transporter ATP-binding protein [Acidimicrobiales bacterium]
MSGPGARPAPPPEPAIATVGLGKRFGKLWALQDCSVSVPRGRVVALVGPNGAGKTTLLRILAGLSSPTTGEARILGRRPEQSEQFLSSIGFLAQEIPLYRQLTARQHIDIGAGLNPRWDGKAALDRLGAVRVPTDRAVGTLSGGQRAQVALGLALAKRPAVLLLDEPVAALDPLARREFLASLAAAVAEQEVSVVLSSHLVHDLERVCDFVVLLAAARVQLCADIEEILDTHRLLVGARKPVGEIERAMDVIRVTQTARQSRVLARLQSPIVDPWWEVAEVGLEDIILAYMGRDAEGIEQEIVNLGATA